MNTLRANEQEDQKSEAKSSDYPKAATRNISLIAEELALYGYVTPELWAMIHDEEKTQASEILTHQEEAYAVVPRVFRQQGEALVDIHNQDLITIVDDGIEDMQRQLSRGVPGADWELRRRQAERKNAGTILAMPAGTACAEISASPYDKPEIEQKAQHYTDLTMIRLSYKDKHDQVMQYNYVLPVSSPEFLRVVQAKLGRSEAPLIGSEELLQNPIIEEINQAPEIVAKRYDSLIGAALLEVSVGQSAVRMIKKSIEGRREAWSFVNSREQTDIDRELLAAMMQAARLKPADRHQAMDAIRSGYWKELKDRFRGNRFTAYEGGILMAAASRAVVDGDVFIACGNTVIATEISEGNGTTTISRAEIVKTLRENITGSGSCGGCGAKGKLFGCGLCNSCNKKWCDIYEKTGKQTEIKDLAYLNYSRPRLDAPDSNEESLAKYWDRLGREIARKRRVKKQRELKALELKKETKLSPAS